MPPDTPLSHRKLTVIARSVVIARSAGDAVIQGGKRRPTQPRIATPKPARNDGDGRERLA